MSVWITRSAPDNLRTARAVHALGWKPLMVPVLTTLPRYQPPVATPPDAIVFTSVHAVRHFARHDQLAAVPVFAASGAVADAAAAAGYLTVTSTGGNDAMLPDLIGHVLPPAARVLLLCGDHRAPAFSDGLAARGCRVVRQPVYKSAPIPDHALTPATDALDRVGAIVVHSRGGAERLVQLLRHAHWRGTLWCISAQTAHICRQLPHVGVQTAARPSEASLLDMIARTSPARPKGPPPERRPDAAVLIPAFPSRLA